MTQQTVNGFSREIKQHTAATTLLFYGYKLYVLYMYMSKALKVRSILLIFFLMMSFKCKSLCGVNLFHNPCLWEIRQDLD